MSRDGSLWIGGLEPYMDEEFLLKCLNSLGETYSGIISIKVIKNKFTGQHGGYGFLNFVNDDVAISSMHKLNGKIMPNTNPPARFKLNHKSTQKGSVDDANNHSIWVGDLSQEVDDFAMYKFFSVRFQSVKSARVMVDETGNSRGFGFVRFGDQQEQLSALGTMQGRTGLGDLPIKVSTAYAKGSNPNFNSGGEFGGEYGGGGGARGGGSSRGGYGSGGTPGEGAPSSRYSAPPSGSSSSTDYSAQWAQYNQYWSQYAAWQQYYASQPGGAAAATAQGGQAEPPKEPEETKETTEAPAKKKPKVEEKNTNILEGNLKEPVANNIPIDVKTFDKEYLARSDELFVAVRSSRWWYQSDV